MGIPYLFRQLVKSFPKTNQEVRVVNDGSGVTTSIPYAVRPPLDFECATLCVDFNGVVHDCARRVMESMSDSSCPSIEGRIIAASIDHLKKLIAIFRPKRHVYVAVDGTPPRAKLHQQRMRRYMATLNGAERQIWDRNAITPGTAFMKQLDDALCALSSNGDNDAFLSVSPSREAGEGEQKLFSWLRRQNHNENSKVVVVGKDADLILMSMSHPARQRIIIAREDDVNGDDDRMSIVNIAELVKSIVFTMDPHASEGIPHPVQTTSDPFYDQKTPDAIKVESSIRDFIVLCSLLGNDFIPPVPTLRLKTGGLSRIVQAYRQCRREPIYSMSFLCGTGPDELSGINVYLLAGILNVLGTQETQDAIRMDAEYRRKVIWVTQKHECDHPHHNKNNNNNTDDESDFPFLNHPSWEWMDALKFGRGEVWRARYHRMLLIGETSSASDHRSAVTAVSILYLAGIVWTLRYLGDQECPSSGWYYAHAHAPTILDINHLVSQGPDRCAAFVTRVFRALDKDHPMNDRGLIQRMQESRYSPQQAMGWLHLMMVLPPSSLSKLVPKHVADSVLSRPETAWMYPEVFELHTYLKEKKHECTPVLPKWRAPPPTPPT